MKNEDYSFYKIKINVTFKGEDGTQIPENLCFLVEEKFKLKAIRKAINKVENYNKYRADIHSINTEDINFDYVILSKEVNNE